MREREAEDLRKELAREYCAALDRKENVLAVAQTWAEVHSLNSEIRRQLKESGEIGEGTPVASWQAVDLSKAQKRDARYYPADSRVYFVRGYGRFAKGDCYEIAGANEIGVVLGKDGRTTTISYRHADRFVVVKAHQQ